MEQQVVFRDYQEQQSADHNNLQAYARASFDHLVGDAVTASRRFSGFNVIKSNQAEVTVAPGRFYDQGGAVYNLPTQTVQSLVAYLPAVSQRIITVAAYGVENQTNVETRDFLTNVTTGQTEPQAVAMTDSRDGVLTLAQGAEGPDPQAPAIPATQVAIANVVLDPNGVVSITMLSANQVTSTESLDTRVKLVEAFDALISPRVSSLASDLAALANKLNDAGQQAAIVSLFQDMALVKEKVSLPQSYSEYGADYFLYPDPTQSDTQDTQHLGFNALVDMGIRFPAQNATTFELSLFSPNDPNAAYAGGLLVPAYASVLKLQTGSYASSIGMAQYGYQTYQLVEQDIAYSRIRSGGSYWVCSNGASGYSPGDTTVAWWLPNFSTYETSATVVNASSPEHVITQTNYYWVDSWTEPYWSLDTVNHTINGAQVAQSFLVSNDMWATQIAFYLASVASATDVWVTLCKCANGMPDLTQVILHQAVPGASLVAGWNTMTCVPTFLSKGDRCAVVLTCAANHQIGMAAGGSYLDGTFFYSMDGTYYLGDLTKEMMLQIWGAKFNASQVTIELGALNLQGGIRDIDLSARTIVPASTQLVYEVLPNGAGSWIPLDPDDPLAPFTGAPVLCRFRARFVGTPDVMPGVQLPGSICKIWCPGPAFTHVSMPETLPAPSANITVQLTVENFNTTAHVVGCKLYSGAYLNPSSTSTQLVDATAGRYTVTCVFKPPAAITSFAIVTTGTTNSVADVFHVAERIFWAL